MRTKVKRNVVWLVGDKSLTLFHGLIVGAAVARYLGPSALGVLAFAGSIFAITSVLTTFGSNAVITREFIVKEDQGTLFWSVLVTRTILGCLAYSLIISAVFTGHFSDIGEDDVWAICIICFPVLLGGCEVARAMLNAKLLSKYAVMTTHAVLLVTSTAKLLLIYFGATLQSFATVTALQGICGTVLLFLFAQRMGHVPKFKPPSFYEVKKLFVECWPLMVSALSIVIYMNVDCLMLRLMVDSTEAGIYSVAVRLSGVLYFFPVALGTSLLPWLAKTHGDSPSYLRTLARFFEINVLVAYASIAIAMLVFPWLIDLLFKEDYAKSIPVFRWHVFGVLFVFLGSARGQHLNLEKHHLFNMLATLSGMVFNVLLNWFLIPRYGSYGAAIATVAGFSLSSTLSSFFHPRLREVGRMQVTSLFTSVFKAKSIIKTIIQ